ncbi:MAG: succinate dehydrogenase [Promethearchaeota archaeon]
MVKSVSTDDFFPSQRLFENSKSDKWWISPLAQFLLLIAFGAYTIWAMFTHLTAEGIEFYKFNQYISPIFSPEIPQLEPLFFSLTGMHWSLSPAFFLIWAPLGFRATCYYARRIYYRIFFMDPPGCAVGEISLLRKYYKGEKQWFPIPFILNNLHRYFLYLALILAAFHWVDVLQALIFPDGSIGLGIGAIIIFLDAFFLTLYVSSCHAFRHLIGGNLDCYSCSKVRYKGWRLVSKLNNNHHIFFWLSLVFVVIADLYIRLLVSGIIYDWRLI